MNYQTLLRSALMLVGLALGGAAAATPSGQMLGNTCAGCHGSDGVSNGPATPTIAGISEEYFVETMKAYKNDARSATIMNRIAKGYTEEEIEAMGKFFANKKFKGQKQTYDTTLAKRGYVLHDKYCEKCHEDRGRSREDDAGILAGQWTPYLQFTFADFVNGTRDMPKKMKKRIEAVHQKSGDDGFKQLLNFYASQND